VASHMYRDVVNRDKYSTSSSSSLCCCLHSIVKPKLGRVLVYTKQSSLNHGLMKNV
jgi:hypothetical protein